MFLGEQAANQFLLRLNLGGKPGLLGSLAERVLPLSLRLLLGFKVYGTRGVDLILCSALPPYLSNGDLVGTVVGAVRIGDVLFAAVPVESFPETRLALVSDVRARDRFLFALADDQLGYDPSESEAPAVKRYSPDDEALFMLSPKLGDAITRTLLEEAESLGFTVTNSKSGSPARSLAADGPEPSGCRKGNPLANAENARWLKLESRASPRKGQ